MAIIGSVTIPERNVTFPKWAGKPLMNDFGRKGVVEFDGKPMFAELALAEILKREGYSVRWEEIYGHSNKLPIFLDQWDERGFKHQVNVAITDEWVMEALAQIAHLNNDSYSGCWDVIAWKDGKLLFGECKRKKRDAIKDTQISWMNAGLQYGLTPENFLILQWDFEDAHPPTITFSA